MSSFVQTRSGIPFFPLAPVVQDIEMRDIAHSLSLLCRYNGHTSRFYSVAEHCVLLSRAVDREHARWALLHDATEAYVGDLVWPLKEEVPDYKRIEDGVMLAVCEKFGLDHVQPDQVKEFDRRIVLDEREALMSPARTPWPALEGFSPLGVQVEGWSPDRAKSEYTSRFRQLFTDN